MSENTSGANTVFQCPVVRFKSGVRHTKNTYYGCSKRNHVLRMNTPAITGIPVGGCNVRGIMPTRDSAIERKGPGDGYTSGVIDAVCGPRNLSCPTYTLQRVPRPKSLVRSAPKFDFALTCPQGRILLASPGRPCEVIKPGSEQYGSSGAELIANSRARCVRCVSEGQSCPANTHRQRTHRCGQAGGTHVCLPCASAACPDGTKAFASKSCRGTQHVCLPCTREACPWDTVSVESGCEFGTHACVPR